MKNDLKQTLRDIISVIKEEVTDAMTPEKKPEIKFKKYQRLTGFKEVFEALLLGYSIKSENTQLKTFYIFGFDLNNTFYYCDYTNLGYRPFNQQIQFEKNLSLDLLNPFKYDITIY